MAADLGLDNRLTFKHSKECQFMILLEPGGNLIVKYEVMLVEQIYLLLIVPSNVLNLGDGYIIRVFVAQAIEIDIGNRFQNPQDDVEWLIWFDHNGCYSWYRLICCLWHH